MTQREPNSDRPGAGGGNDLDAPGHGEGHVVVRPAKAGELPAIRRLIGLYPDELVQDELPRVSSFFVAESDGSIIGCCALQVYSRRLAEVRSLAIHPDFRGKGPCCAAGGCLPAAGNRAQGEAALCRDERAGLLRRMWVHRAYGLEDGRICKPRPRSLVSANGVSSGQMLRLSQPAVSRPVPGPRDHARP